MYCIYGLRDPRTFHICYVGVTVNHPVWRLAQHLQDKETVNVAKHAWLADLKSIGARPDIVVLQYAPDETEAAAIEHWWIKKGAALGWPLTNLAGKPKYPHVERREARQPARQPSREVRPRRRATIPPPPVPAGPTDLQAAVWHWREQHPSGTQAELRRDFDARGIGIARGYANELWHKWPGVQSDGDLRPGTDGLTLADIRAMIDSGVQIRSPEGNKR